MVINYHNITYPDMLNGDGLRVVLWLSGCSHNCYKCQNPQTHDPNSGILFDEKAEEELFRELSKDYISGLTLTGGDPLHENNLDEVLNLVNKIRLLMPEKTIWLYTGYTFENLLEIMKNDNGIKDLLKNIDVLVDGKFQLANRKAGLRFRGSSNQRIIDIKEDGKIIFSVPICWEINTFEDDSIVSAEDRLREYGQEDHVRLYGKDIEQRLTEYGFEVKGYQVDEILPAKQIEEMRLIPKDRMWVLTLK